MNTKFYYKKWFVIIWLILLAPLGIFLAWKSPSFTPKGKKVAIIISAVWFVIVLLAPEPPKAESTYDVKSSEITYKTEDIPAKEAVYEDAESYTTELSGEYTIGVSPKELSTGEEESFTTAQSGNYIAGTDFPAGVYDIVAIEGNGNVMGTGLNEIMGVGTGVSSIDEMYVTKYDNHEFKEGDNLKVSGVSVELQPQTDDPMAIAPNTYNLSAVSGNGNVIGTGINEIMGVGTGVDSLDNMYVEQYDNLKLKEGDNLKVMGVSIALEPVEKQVMVKEATEAIPGHEQTETLTSSPKGEVCTVDGKETDCNEVAKYDELKSSLEVETTVTEAVSYDVDDNYVCTIDGVSEDCNELVDYDNLVAQLEALKTN